MMDGDSYEEMRALEQELSFTSACREFEKRNMDFGEQQKQTLKDRREFTGSLL